MPVTGSNFLGQIIPTESNQGLSGIDNKDIFTLCQGRKIQVFVGSANGLKVEAAKKAVEIWARNFLTDPVINIQGFDVPSGINEQPNGSKNTMTGAVNRLLALKENVKNILDNDLLTVYVSMENGLIPEVVHNLRNPETFLLKDKFAYVDRCIIVGHVVLKNKLWPFTSVSVGVTTPRECVELAEKSNWSKTAGSFIAEKYQWNPKDWHGSIAGKSRQTIMEEAILLALGLQK